MTSSKSKFDLNKWLKYHNIDDLTKKNLYTHKWFDKYHHNPTVNCIFCENCNINLSKVVYRERSENSNWNELTCNEILMKNLLE